MNRRRRGLVKWSTRPVGAAARCEWTRRPWSSAPGGGFPSVQNETGAVALIGHSDP